jgi:hypothetical protein
MMNVYVFGNPDANLDNRVFGVVKKVPDLVRFVWIKPNEDLPFLGNKTVVILDTVEGIEKVTEIDETSLDKLMVSRSITAHDYDLGFQLKYLVKLGKLKKFKIIGIPQKGTVNYLRVQSILRKLVAQDIQGS